ncbi:WD-repeat protein [Seminavis robusta]|uniref:WD-repeat protein n=1 Tax=Seminavis robusta TaxID=568900 RepID=A0A9N8EEG9_9STRA|nr:WD-repeat protein [Seminavis robusta]|eukprot:Sro1033_g233770.1 WD-repeat protein (703) ;mRNA; f:35771-38000
MVVGALVTYFAPSNRGFVRIKDSNNAPFDSFPVHTSLREDEREKPRTALRRKPLRAMAVLTSIASDFDLISDWAFYRQSLRQDREYRKEFEANPVEGDLPYLIPPRLMHCVLASCILGSIMWIVVATEGRIVSPVTTRLGIDKLSMGLVLFIAVLVEDLPQILLVFLIEDYYEEGGFLSEVAVFNLMASLYDTCIKLAESYDQRHDVVETGVWCKKSIRGHEATITDIFVLPEGVELPAYQSNNQRGRRRSTSDSVVQTIERHRSTGESSSDGNNASTSSLPTSVFRRSSRSQKPLIVEAFFPEGEALAPRIHFLTTSMDMTAKLWNVASLEQTSTTNTKNDKQCVDFYSDVEGNGFTCMAWVGPKNPKTMVAGSINQKHFVLFGMNNGVTKLWDLSGLCHRTYQVYGSRTNRVASISASGFGDNHIFVCGHESGDIRLWQTWIGTCLGQIRAHDKRVTSIKFLDNGNQFVSASADAMLKLWDTNNHFHGKKEDHGVEVSVSDSNSGVPNLANSAPNISVPPKYKELHGEHDVPVKKFLGHTAAVLDVVCVDQKNAILSGSADYSARLWSLETGLCLRVFRGHSDGVYSVLAIDRVTFLTGSNDATIKAWDALSGECLRTYEGHRSCVTGLALGAVSQDATESATTFLSCSADKSIKCWVLTAVSYRDPAATLDHILTCTRIPARALTLPHIMQGTKLEWTW